MNGWLQHNKGGWSLFCRTAHRGADHYFLTLHKVATHNTDTQGIHSSITTSATTTSELQSTDRVPMTAATGFIPCLLALNRPSDLPA